MLKKLLLEVSESKVHAIKHLSTVLPYFKNTKYDNQFEKIADAVNEYKFEEAQIMLKEMIEKLGKEYVVTKSQKQ